MDPNLLGALLGMAGGEGGLPEGLEDLLGGGGGDNIPRVGISGNTGPTKYEFSVTYDPREEDDVTRGRIEEACATILNGVGVGLEHLPFARVMADAMTNQISEMRAAHERGEDPSAAIRKATIQCPVITSDGTYHLLETDAVSLHTAAMTSLSEELGKIPETERPAIVRIEGNPEDGASVVFVYADGNEELQENGVSEALTLVRRPAEELGEEGPLVLVAANSSEEDLARMGIRI
jgi:hypothetical protein